MSRSIESLRATALVMSVALGAISCGGSDDVFGNVEGTGGATSSGATGTGSGQGGATAAGSGAVGSSNASATSSSTASAGSSTSGSSSTGASSSATTSSSAASTSASASSGSGGGGPCAPAPTDSVCDTCIKTSCCALLTTCKSQPVCNCWFDCMDMTMFDYFTCGTMCGFPNGTSSMLYDCINVNCGTPCPP